MILIKIFLGFGFIIVVFLTLPNLICRVQQADLYLIGIHRDLHLSRDIFIWPTFVACRVQTGTRDEPLKKSA